MSELLPSSSSCKCSQQTPETWPVEGKACPLSLSQWWPLAGGNSPLRAGGRPSPAQDLGRAA